VESVEVLGGRYRLVERLGMGGMSVVWRAYDEVLNRQVAIKVLAAKLAADRDSREMIRAEAQSAARLSHPHVTGVYDYGESTTRDGDTVPYVVMELISGRTLAERLAGGPLPWRAALRVGAEVAAALAAAHARGLVHRDVKPANVMLTASGAKVVDFGIAAVAGETGEPSPGGVVLGTPAYLAPERLAGGPVRPATDVYGLGLVLYRALTGRLPWAAETTTQIINAHVYAEPACLPPITGLPDGVAELCLRCLAKNPADRPTSREVGRALAAAAGIRVPLPASTDDPDDLVLDPALFAYGPLAGRPPGRLRLAVAALFGPGVDAAAETSILPGSVIDSAAIRNIRRLRRRRALQVVGATAGLATAGLVLTTCADLPRGQGTTLAIAGQTGVNRAACAVRYLTRSDNASQFNVDVTVTNSSSNALDAWTLQFTFTGDQKLSEGSAGEWTQSPTGAVTVRGPAGQSSLAAGAARSLSFSAGYHDSNPMPTSFTLNGAACSYVLVGASGETRTGGPPPGLTGGSDVEAAGGDGVTGGTDRGVRGGQGVPAAPAGGPPAGAPPAGGLMAGGQSPGPGPGSGSPSPTGGSPSPSATGGGGVTPSPSTSASSTPPPTPTVSPQAAPEPSPSS
jgi:serine/threonine-protein kinase